LTPLRGNTIYPQPDQYNAVWIDFPGITAAHAGSYDVTIRAAAAGPAGASAGAELHITLDVQSESLPPQRLLHTEWFHTDCLADFYKVGVFSEAHWDIIDAFMEPMARRYGINTVLTPVFTPPLDTAVGAERLTVQLVDIEAAGGAYSFDFGKLGRWCGLCKKHGITHLEIAHFFTQWGAKWTPKIVVSEGGVEKRIFGWDVPAGSPAYRAFLARFVPALRGALERYGYDRGHTFFHVSDEPHGAAQREDYRIARAQVADLLEGSVIIDALSDVSFYHEGVLQHPVAANDAIGPFLEAKIPWLWTYYCVAQSYLVPNRFIALRSPRTRAMGVLMYYFDIAGFLQWGYNYYYSALSETLLDPFFKTGGLKNWPGGDPFLVYPGADGRPLSSIRGEVIRESIEDMRVLALVEARLGREASRALIKEGFPGELSFERYPLEPAFYTGLRERAAELLGRAGSRAVQ
jgi:hypothetical protein